MNFVRRLLKKEYPFILACPALLWQFLFLYIPLFFLILRSLFEYSEVQNTYVFTGAFYAQVFSTLYFNVAWHSFLLALQTTVICLCIAYPVSYFLAFKAKRYRMVALFFLIVPSWTSLIIQIYAWMFLLTKGGVVSNFLYSIGILAQPTHLLNNRFAMLLGMVYCYLPFMILPIYAALQRVDRSLLEASADLGASKFQTARRVIFPLCRSGVFVGALLVFIPSFGEFAIPGFLGGGKVLLWGNVIVSKFLEFRDWKSGAAVACAGVLYSVLLLFATYICYRVVWFVFSGVVQGVRRLLQRKGR